MQNNIFFYDNKNDNRFKIGFIETKIGLPKKPILTTLVNIAAERTKM